MDIAPWRLEPPQTHIDCQPGELPTVRHTRHKIIRHETAFFSFQKPNKEQRSHWCYPNLWYITDAVFCSYSFSGILIYCGFFLDYLFIYFIALLTHQGYKISFTYSYITRDPHCSNDEWEYCWSVSQEQESSAELLSSDSHQMLMMMMSCSFVTANSKEKPTRDFHPKISVV